MGNAISTEMYRQIEKDIQCGEFCDADAVNIKRYSEEGNEIEVQAVVGKYYMLHDFSVIINDEFVDRLQLLELEDLLKQVLNEEADEVRSERAHQEYMWQTYLHQ